MNRISTLAPLALALLLSGCQRENQEELQTYESLKDKPAAETAQDQTSQPKKVEPAQPNVVNPLAQNTPIGEREPVVAMRPDLKDSQVTVRPPVVAMRPEAANAQASVQDNKTYEMKLLVPNKKFETVGPEQAVRVSYDDVDLLKVLNMEPVPLDAREHFPAWLKSLDGKRIRIRGFMYPPEIETGLRGFVLARDNEICCFGRDPKIYDLIKVHMRDGVTTNYIPNRPFDVVGVFRIDPYIYKEKYLDMYHLTDAVVIQGRR